MTSRSRSLDEDGAISDAFGTGRKVDVRRKYMGMERATYLIGSDAASSRLAQGQGAGHAAEVLKAVADILLKRPSPHRAQDYTAVRQGGRFQSCAACVALQARDVQQPRRDRLPLSHQKLGPRTSLVIFPVT
jgi:hypothetical protein